ncbi:hypothetical protein [Phaeacidiphilus oryzae]|uniref:hypothetical protein n=1 Tax=Phaeacidiphilus oryzae TaxID=348818 RepID=UPI00068F19A0|nr:hypothetical protein [Phaeacidiphilus oryzae]
MFLLDPRTTPKQPYRPPQPQRPPRSRRPTPAPDTFLADLALPLAYASAAVLSVVLLLALGHRYALVAIVLFGCLAAIAAVPARLVWSPVIGLVCWLFVDGFLLGSGGALALRTGYDRLALIVIPAACAGSAVGALLRRRSRR